MRAAKSCPSDFKYYASVDACIPLGAASSQFFLAAFTTRKTCAGGTIATTQDLEALRFCDIVTGGLTITESDRAADFTSLWYISEIRGMFVCAVQAQAQMLTGPLVVMNSSMVTMEDFRFLGSIGSSSSHTHVNGNAYALVIDGLMCARSICKV